MKECSRRCAPFQKICRRGCCVCCERPLCASARVRRGWWWWWGDSGGAERREEMLEMVEVCNCETPGCLSNPPPL